jgi:hypothetical protein
MATRYWVGGETNSATNPWNATATANWSTTSGGAGGASAPTIADDVVFDANSAVWTSITTYYNVIVATGAVCKNFSAVGSGIEGPRFKPDAASSILEINGSMAVPLNRDSVYWAKDTGKLLTIKFSSTTTGNTISVSADTTTCGCTFDGVGGEWTLLSRFVVNSGEAVTLTNGVHKLNALNLTAGYFYSSNSNVRTLNFGGIGTSGITLYGSSGTVFDCTNSTNLTVVTAIQRYIYLIGTGTKTFAGGGKTWGTVTLEGNTVTVTGSNTFQGVFNAITATPMTLLFTAGTTQTFLSTVNLSGAASNLLTINSTVSGTQATLSKAAVSTVTANYVNIKDSNATGGAAWLAYNATNSGNNTGWAFPGAVGSSMMMFC